MAHMYQAAISALEEWEPKANGKYKWIFCQLELIVYVLFIFLTVIDWQ